MCGCGASAASMAVSLVAEHHRCLHRWRCHPAQSTIDAPLSTTSRHASCRAIDDPVHIYTTPKLWTLDMQLEPVDAVKQGQKNSARPESRGQNGPRQGQGGRPRPGAEARPGRPWPRRPRPGTWPTSFRRPAWSPNCNSSALNFWPVCMYASRIRPS